MLEKEVNLGFLLSAWTNTELILSKVLTQGLEATRCPDYRGITFQRLCVSMRPQGWWVLVGGQGMPLSELTQCVRAGLELGASPGKESESGPPVTGWKAYLSENVVKARSSVVTAIPPFLPLSCS